MKTAKPILRALLPGRIYITLAEFYRAWVSLWSYPSTFSVSTDYDLYWHVKAGLHLGELSSFRRARAETIAGKVDEGSSLLDIGCGDGALLKFLVERKRICAFGIDISATALKAARHAGLDVVLADAGDSAHLPMEGPFDYVLLSEILEHLAQPEILVSRLRAMVRKAVIVTIPNTGWIRHRLRLLLGRFPVQWVAHPAEHLRFWTVIDFKWWAARTGYTVREIIPYRGIPFLRQMWPNLFAEAVVFVLDPSRPSTRDSS